MTETKEPFKGYTLKQELWGLLLIAGVFAIPTAVIVICKVFGE